MAKQRACKICKTIFEGKDTCPKCGAKDFTEAFKGRIVILDPEKSEIAQKVNMKEKGEFAIKA